MQSLDHLKLSLSTLYEEFGRADWKIGLVINSATIAIGVALYWVTSWPANFAGFCIAILGLWGIVTWVMGW